MAATASAGERTSGRRFFSTMAIFMIVCTLIGFAPSFYLRGLVHYPRPNPTLNPLIILHGTLFTVWMLIFWTQARLIGAGRRDLHMKLGIGGMLLAVALVPLMYLAAVGGVARGSAPHFTTPLAWTAVPLGSLAAFIALIYLGWRQRRNGQAHKRLMLCAALVLMGPAIGRFPIAPPVLTGHIIQQSLAWCTVIPLFFHDSRTLGHIHWATKLGAGLLASAVILGIAGIVLPGWPAIASHLPGL